MRHVPLFDPRYVPLFDPEPSAPRGASVTVTQQLCGNFAVASLKLLNRGHIEA